MNQDSTHEHPAALISGTPVITEMSIIPVAGYDSMLLNLSGAHGACCAGRRRSKKCHMAFLPDTCFNESLKMKSDKPKLHSAFNPNLRIEPEHGHLDCVPLC